MTDVLFRFCPEAAGRRWCALFGLLAMVVAGSAQVESAFATETGPVSASRLEAGPHPVEQWGVVLEDHTRPTAPNGKFKGTPYRRFKTTLWYPAQKRSLEGVRPGAAPCLEAAGPLPLVIYSHGFMSFRTEGRYLAEHLASLGYVVVAVNFPLTNYFAPGDPNLADVVNQPDDVRFLIDTLLDHDKASALGVQCVVDPQRVAAVGLSLGGMTSTLAAFHKTLRDPRVAAAVSIAGPISMFNDVFYAYAEVPFLMVAGDIDAIINYEANAGVLLERAPTSTLVTIRGASHTGFAHISRSAMRWRDNPDAMGCNHLDKYLPDDEASFGGLGGETEGVVLSADDLPCQNEVLLRALRPRRQQDLTQLAVTSFLESRFAASADAREAAALFLNETLQAENAEIWVATPNHEDAVGEER